MKEITKQGKHGVKFPSTEYDPLWMKTSEGAPCGEKLEKLDSQREKLLFTKYTPRGLHAMQKIYKRAPQLLMYWIKHHVTCRPLHPLKCHQAQFRSYNNSKGRVHTLTVCLKTLQITEVLLSALKSRVQIDTSTGRDKMQFEAHNDLLNSGKNCPVPVSLQVAVSVIVMAWHP